MTLPLSKLFVTDFDRLTHIMANDMDPEYTTPVGKLGSMSAFEVLMGNASVLGELGCQLAEDGGPFNAVSGFAKQEADSADVQVPEDIIPAGTKVGMLLWGSPHPNPSACTGQYHGSHDTGADYKTQAFESMAWLAPEAFIAMPFPEKYRVEFYQPLHHKSAVARTLVVTRIHVQQYVPMCSSNGYRYSIYGVDKDSIMVAMLVPPRYLSCLSFKEGALDLGMTILNVLLVMPADERGVALGCYDLSCEMEIYLAWQRMCLEKP